MNINHFDSTRYDQDGVCLRRSSPGTGQHKRKSRATGGTKGRASKIRPDDVVVILALFERIDQARQELVRLLTDRGFVTDRRQRDAISKIRSGWRPKK